MKRRLSAALLCLLCLLLFGCTSRQERSAQPDPETARFATMTGTVQEVLIEDLYPEAQVLRYDGFSDVMLALQENKADYALLSTHLIRTTAGNTSVYDIILDNLHSSGVGAAVTKQNTALLNELNDCLRKLKADGTLDDLVRRWMVPEGQYRPVEIPDAEGKNGVLRVGTSAGYAPMEFVMNGQITGSDIELVRRIGLMLDKKVEIVDIPFASLLAALSTGQIDVIFAGMAITEERMEVVNFTDSYYEDRTALVRYEPDAMELPEKTTAHYAVLTGSNSAELIRETYPDAKLSYYDSTPDCIMAVSEGKADFAPVTYYNTLPILEAWPELMTINSDLQAKKIAMAVAKGNTDLRNRVNELLALWQEDGTLADMQTRWFRRDGEYIPAELPEAAAGAKTLHVGVVATQEPFCFLMEGKYAGFDVELTARIAEALGMAVKYTDVPMTSLFAGLDAGTIDIVASAVGVTDERKEIVDFTDSYVINPIALVCRRAGGAASGAGLSSIADSLKASIRRTFITESRWRMLAAGLWLTFVISLLFGIFGTVLGFGLCLLRRSRNPIPRMIVDGLCRLIQGVPMVVFLLVLNYVILVRTGLNGAAVSVIAFSLVFGCSVCGMLTVGLEGVDRGELEAGLALGYTPTQVFCKIGLPQAIRQVLPLYRGEFVGTMKLTSIVGYIAVQDLTKAGDLIRSRTLEAFFPLLVTAALYFLLANILSAGLLLIERMLEPKRRKRTLKGVKM